ncbi:MAG: hypothetical protein JWP35_2548 [Caulobacter sp.]|nr:hypothetical protein [Caulobacter sp.]
MSLKIQTTRGRLLASTMICGVLSLGVGGHAFAADDAAAKDSGSEVTEVVVTGSRLQRKDFQAISPVTTVGSEQLELTGTVAVEQLINELPQVVPGNTITSNNTGGEDFATVDLRGLGANRTLVVVNGERVPGSSTSGTVDLNTLPAGLIDRIEVLTGGASAVYGSDALAGVVNFILKQNYEGAEVSALIGSNFKGYAKEFSIDGLVGGNFADGRGNITMYASFYQRNALLASAYDWSKNAVGLYYDDASQGYVVNSAAQFNTLKASLPDLDPDGAGPLLPDGVTLHTGFVDAGSATAPWGTIVNDAGNAFNAAALIANPLTAGRFAATDRDCNAATPGTPYPGGSLSFNDAGQLMPSNTGQACSTADRAAGSSRYNFSPTNDLILPAKRYSFSAFGHYDITDNITLKTQLSFTDSQSGVQLAATPATGMTVVLTPAMHAYIAANHPDLNAALNSRPNPTANFTENWRSLQLGPRVGEYDNAAFSLLATLDGKINDNWNWSATASYGQTNFGETLKNNVNKTALAQGLTGCQAPIPDSQVLIPNPGQGTPLGVTALPGCTITDIFGANKLSAAAVSFLRVNTHQSSSYTEQRVAAFIRGDIMQLPAGGLAAVFGFEYREDHANLQVDDAQRTGNIYGFNAIQDQKGGIVVKEGYLELALPLLKDVPFAQYLGLEAGYRWSDYDTIGGTETYKIGGEWTPVSFLKFRAVYNKAVRAPNVFELFQNGDQGFAAFTDPCRSSQQALPGRLAFCQSQAPAASFVGFGASNAQVQVFSFGNPNLRPETGKTYTIGAVFQPDFLPVGRLKASLDYYNIEITDAVGAIGSSTVLSRCYAAQSLADFYCQKIVRNPVTGQIDSINTSIDNIAFIKTKGWDAQADFNVELGDMFSGAPGRLYVNELFSLLESYNSNGTELKGYTGGIFSEYPTYKSVLTVRYTIADWLFQVRWSYVPEMKQFDAIDNGLVNVPKAPAASYVDLSTRWNVTDNFQITGTIGNVFDKEPPLIQEGVLAGQYGTDTGQYRTLGRTFTLAAKVRF